VASTGGDQLVKSGEVEYAVVTVEGSDGGNTMGEQNEKVALGDVGGLGEGGRCRGWARNCRKFPGTPAHRAFSALGLALGMTR